MQKIYFDDGSDRHVPRPGNDFFRSRRNIDQQSMSSQTYTKGRIPVKSRLYCTDSDEDGLKIQSTGHQMMS